MRVCIIIFCCISLISACKKDGIITSADALLYTSTDSLHYDTVFTTIGSVTKSFKIINPNNQKIILSNVQLMGGSSSFFKINVDGTAGSHFSNISINANDSMYVFAMVSINPNANNLPFIVKDSIKIEYNGNSKFVQLDAFGQNANFFRNKRITSDTSWSNTLPFVIIGSLIIDSTKTLTINKGCKIYCNNDAPIIVNGTLKAIGEKYDSTKIIFTGIRLDAPYRDFPGSWPGIYFNTNSKNNVMQFCNISNAYQALIVNNVATNNNPKLTLQETIIDNTYDIGIGGSNSSIDARNCLISNCGNNIYLTAGGNYNFNHCTVVSYSNYYLLHKNPVLSISNNNNNNGNNLNCYFKNSIIYGEGGLIEDEIVINKIGNAIFNVNFDNVLYKLKNNEPTIATFTGNKLKNIAPNFDSINNYIKYYNFRLKPNAAAINKGTNSGILFDLDGNNRNIGLPDLGCYEIQ